MSNVSEIVPLPDDHERATILQQFVAGNRISQHQSGVPESPSGMSLITGIKIS